MVTSKLVATGVDLPYITTITPEQKGLALQINTLINRIQQELAAHAQAINNLPPGNLNAGTGAGPTTFWRGDGQWSTVSGAGGGTVTSAALTMPGQFTVGGSPITSSGTFAVTWNAVSANTFLAGPTSGPAAAPTFRGLVAADITTLFPLLAPNGSPSAPSYSWSGETNSGIYRPGTNGINLCIAGADVIDFSPNTFIMGGNVAAGNQDTFYYPLDSHGSAANGYTIKINRLQVGLEVLFSQTFAPASSSWATTYLNGDAMTFASIGVTSQIGGYPVVGATRTSDFRTAFGSVSNGSGTYFLALNDDTTGNPIASGCNPTAWRAANVGGVTEACQIDVENAGSVVDVDAHLGFPAGTTIGLNVTCGAFNSTSAASSAAVTFDHTGTGKFRKGIMVTASTLDATVGTFGAGILINTPVGTSWQWINASTGATIAEFGATTSGCGPIGALKAGSLGIWPGIGDGGTVTQTTSITTAVTLNTISGQITTVSNNFTAGGATAFTLDNSLISATDVIVLTTGTTNIIATPFNIQGGSVGINLQSFATFTTAVVINFMVLKVATS